MTWASSSTTFALCILLMVGFSETAIARTVSVRWSNPDPSLVTGYRVYTRTATGSFGVPVYDGSPAPIGGVYTIQLDVADSGVTYMVATAYNDVGESARSNELAFAPPACGDGVVGTGEQCDDGNKTAGDGCNATCRIEACGNGVKDAGEQCDDGNKTAGDGCSATCRIEACGNGVDGRGRAVRRREQDGGRRLQRDMPDRGVRQRRRRTPASSATTGTRRRATAAARRAGSRRAATACRTPASSATTGTRRRATAAARRAGSRRAATACSTPASSATTGTRRRATAAARRAGSRRAATA